MVNTNPSVAEIREWAYSNAPWPTAEWDLFLSWTGDVGLLIELATDHLCPHRLFFVHVLYYLVGLTFTSCQREEAISRVSWYADKGRAVKHGDIKRWVRNVDSLTKGRIEYRYQDWRGGRLAGYDFT